MAIALVSVAVLTIVGVYIGGLKLSAKSERVLLATEVAQSTLERIRELGYDKIPPEDSVFSGRKSDPPTVDGFPPSPYPGEQDYSIEVTSSIKETDLKSVAVRVYYDQRNSVVLQTYFTPFQ